MARNDIKIYVHQERGTIGYPIDSGQTFLEGEPVVVQADGTLAECSDDPSVVSGIAMGTSQGKDGNGDDGSVPTGTLITIYKPAGGQLFYSLNFATDGAGTAATPAQSNVGDTAGFTLDGSGDWWVDTGTANLHVEVVAVLDGNGQPIGSTNVRTAGTGVAVVFGFLQP